MTPKHVAFVGAICILVGWLLASTLTPPTARVQSLPERPAPRRESAEAPLTEQLHLRLNEVRPAPANRRNPFVFAGRDRDRVDESVTSVTPVEAVAVEPRVAGPPFVLSGIGISGDTRTAVLASGDDVRIVAVDDAIDGYTVAEITNHTVTLVKGVERYVLQFSAQ